jgi:hypothetical protein
VIRVTRLQGALQHSVVALLFACAAAVLYVEDVPWSLLGLVAAVGLLIVAPRLGFDEMVEMLLTGAVLLLAIFHIQDALLHPAVGAVFLNQTFVLHLVGVAALITAGAIARRRDLPLGYVLSIVGWLWAGFVLANEIARLELEILPQLVHAAVIVVVLVVAVSPIRTRIGLAWMGSLVVLSIATAWWAAFDAPMQATWAFVFLAPLPLIAMAVRAGQGDDAGDPVAPVFAVAIPLVLAPWALQLGRVIALHTPFFAVTLVVLSVLVIAYWGRASEWRAPVWTNAIGLYFWATALAMAGLLLAYIERGLWPVAFDVASVATLAMLAWAAPDDRKNVAGGVTVAIAAFVLQAMLLRWFGPAGILTVADLARMELPAVVSFMWATLGGAICWWSSRIASRGLWGVGATLLALSAIKLVLFDFGSLGELANIVALLLAGAVFLAVAWLAPIPPKGEEVPRVAPRSGGQDGTASARPASASSSPAEACVARPAARASSRPHVPDSRASVVVDEVARSWRTMALLVVLSLAVLVILFNKSASGGRASTSITTVPVEAPAPAEPPAAPESPVPMLPQAVAPVVAETLVAEPPAPVLQPPRVVDACTQFLERLPSDFVLLAGGAYQGRELAFQIDQSGHEATGFDVVVNMPGRPVVLVLGAYEPSVWQIRRGAGTRIAGVFVTGYHRQAVFGLSAATPMMNSSYGEKGPCGHSYLAGRNPDSMDSYVRRVFGRQAESYYLASNGQLLMGSGAMPGSTVQDAPGSFESFRDVTAPLAGIAGLEDLLSKGVLRRARSSDLAEWKAAKRNAQGSSVSVVGAPTEMSSSSSPFNTFVVQREMTFPAGLYGANAAKFIVPKGVPAPRGNPGHSAVYDWNSLTCSGPLCGQGQW